MADGVLLVEGCPYCDIFSGKQKNISTKLYYPIKSQINKSSEFIILNCPNCNKPMVIFRDHVTSISKEQWGRILYRCRLLFGNGMRLQIDTYRITDHWHAHIINVNTTKLYKTKDLRRY